MQITEKSPEGLSRSYGVHVPAAELGALLDARIAEITPTLRLKGFRPGKVPPHHVRRMFGKALMSEVVEKTLSESSQKVLSDNNLRIAAQPDLKPSSDMEKVIAGAEDLAFDLEVEVMPDFEPADVTGLELTRLVYQPSHEELDAALAELATQNRTYEVRQGKLPKARAGDQILMDFVGRIEGETFEGGAADDAEIVLGAGQFIPGFEDQLLGAAPGDEVLVEVTFPEDYQAEHLKGRAAQFTVKVKEVREPRETAVDDALAQRLGMADLAALTDAVRANIEREYKEASRFKLKRALLDALDARHDIALPPRMVEAEFDSIWRQIEEEREHGHLSPEDADKSEESLRAEYRQIAERRVRLGLVLAEIGRRENVTVTEAELGEAMRAEAMRYGAQAQQIFDMMRQNSDMQTQMRAPLYEEKVVDLIVGRAQVTDKAVSKEELLADDEEPTSDAAPAKKGRKAKATRAHSHDHDHDHDHDHGHDRDHAKADAAPAAKSSEAKPSRVEATETKAPKTKAAASKEESSDAEPKAARSKASKAKTAKSK